jgi:hypothetical protein
VFPLEDRPSNSEDALTEENKVVSFACDFDVELAASGTADARRSQRYSGFVCELFKPSLGGGDTKKK